MNFFLLKPKLKKKKNYYAPLSLRGVGYRVWRNSSFLHFDLGFTHYKSVSVFGIARKNRLLLKDSYQDRVHTHAYEIKKLKVRDPYKGKGIRSVGEVIPLKPGKVKN